MIDGVEIVLLVGERVLVVARLVGLTPAEEVEHDDVAVAQVRDEPVVQVVVVGEAVHEHDGRARAALLSRWIR